MLKSTPIGLYIHFPWCVKKCPYCDFNSHQQPNKIPEQLYIDTLIKEIVQHKKTLRYRHIDSIFMGGGTPSLFSAKQLKRLLNFIKSEFHCKTNIEITMEANPGTIEHQPFSDYLNAGINRYSLGIQSFNDLQLKKLGRIHDSDEAINAVEAVKKAGGANINLDIMYALPEQTTAEALRDLEAAIALQPQHLSWYQLTLEPNTLFHRYPPKLPNHDEAAEIQQQGQALLAKHHYHQYEISAYSKKNRQCQHNLNYWHFGDYLGIGAGAHSKLTSFTKSGEKCIKRFINTKHPQSYLNPKSDFIIQEIVVLEEQWLFEFFMNRMRLTAPITEEELIAKTGKDFSDIAEQLRQLNNDNLISINKASALELTINGRNFLNDVLQTWL
jgi:putative oxygen-independent coproporphyrinogen III oxidase